MNEPIPETSVNRAADVFQKQPDGKDVTAAELFFAFGVAVGLLEERVHRLETLFEGLLKALSNE